MTTMTTKSQDLAATKIKEFIPLVNAQLDKADLANLLTTHLKTTLPTHQCSIEQVDEYTFGLIMRLIANDVALGIAAEFPTRLVEHLKESKQKGGSNGTLKSSTPTPTTPAPTSTAPKTPQSNPPIQRPESRMDRANQPPALKTPPSGKSISNGPTKP